MSKMNEYVSVQGDRVEEIRERNEWLKTQQSYITGKATNDVEDFDFLLSKIDSLRKLVAEDEARLNHAERIIEELKDLREWDADTIRKLTAKLEEIEMERMRLAACEKDLGIFEAAISGNNFRGGKR